MIVVKKQWRRPGATEVAKAEAEAEAEALGRFGRVWFVCLFVWLFVWLSLLFPYAQAFPISFHLLVFLSCLLVFLSFLSCLSFFLSSESTPQRCSTTCCNTFQQKGSGRFSRVFCLTLFFPRFLEKKEKKRISLFLLSFFSHGQITPITKVFPVQLRREGSPRHGPTIPRPRTRHPHAP